MVHRTSGTSVAVLLRVKKKLMSTYSGRPDGHDKHSDDASPQRSDEQQRDEDAARHRQTVGPRRQQVIDDARYYQRQEVPFVYHSNLNSFARLSFPLMRTSSSIFPLVVPDRTLSKVELTV